MIFDIRTAALDDVFNQRVRLAASLLGAFRLRARVDAWDGTRCHLLIAAADDAYGQRTLALARERGTAVIALGDQRQASDPAGIDANTTASELARHIRTLLQAPQSGPERSGDNPQPGLCQLALPPLRGNAIDASCNGRTLFLRPQVGRVYAATHSDLLALNDALSGSDWDMSVVENPGSTQDLVSASLDAFVMHAAYRIAERLPDFADGRYRLDAWPDLGSLPSLVSALQVSRLLIGNTRNLRDLIEHAGDIDRAELNACLWALAAADLLRAPVPTDNVVAMPVRAQRMQSGIWSKLASRFGLLRA